jgi:hypothetical protein
MSSPFCRPEALSYIMPSSVPHGRDITCLRGCDLYLILLQFVSHAWNCVVSLASWGYFIKEQWPHPPLKVVIVMARHSCCLTMPVGFTLLTCGLSPHSQ